MLLDWRYFSGGHIAVKILCYYKQDEIVHLYHLNLDDKCISFF